MTKKNILRIVMISAITSIIINGCAKQDNVTLDRDKFLGTWHVTSHHSDTTIAATETWDLSIEPASAAAAEQIVMKNFNQTGADKTVYADVSGSNLTIPGTVVYLSGGAGQETIEGTGSLSGSTLSFTYTSYDGQITDHVTATAIK